MPNFGSLPVVTDSGQIVVREQWDHPYKEGSSLFRFHISVAILFTEDCRLLGTKIATKSAHAAEIWREI